MYSGFARDVPDRQPWRVWPRVSIRLMSPQLPVSGLQIEGGHPRGHRCRQPDGRVLAGLQRGRPGSVKLRLGPITGGQQGERCDTMRCVFVWRRCTYVGRDDDLRLALLLALPLLLDAQLGWQGRGTETQMGISTLGLPGRSQISIARFGHEAIPVGNARDAEQRLGLGTGPQSTPGDGILAACQAWHCSLHPAPMP